MIHDILRVAEDTDIVKIIDTDSLFIRLGKQDDLRTKITDTENFVNGRMRDFQNMHNMNRTDLVYMWLKNEFKINKIIAYTKKRYIADTIELEKNARKVEIRGIEGRRATMKFVLDIVEHLQNYVQQENAEIDLKAIYYDVFKKIEAAFCKFNISYLAQPINPPKSFTELKSVQSPARGMINFDIFVSEVFAKVYTKGLHLPIHLSEEALQNRELEKKCKEILKRYSKFPAIKMERKKKDTDATFYARIIKDLTIPEVMMNAATLEQIQKLGIRIDFVGLLKIFFKKFTHLFSPVFDNDPNFNFMAEFEKTYNYVLTSYYVV